MQTVQNQLVPIREQSLLRMLQIQLEPKSPCTRLLGMSDRHRWVPAVLREASLEISGPKNALTLVEVISLRGNVGPTF